MNVCPANHVSPFLGEWPTTYPAAQARLLRQSLRRWKPPAPSAHISLSFLSFQPVCSSKFISDLSPSLHLHRHYASPSPPTGSHLKPLTGHPAPTVYSPPTSQRDLVHPLDHVTPLGKPSALRGPAGVSDFQGPCPSPPDTWPRFRLQCSLSSAPGSFRPQGVGICYFQPHGKLLAPNCPHRSLFILPISA